MKRTLAIFALQLCDRGMPVGANGRHGDSRPDPAAKIPVTQPSNVTFTKDVAPIVQQHCQGCHRPGEGTPFSMLTYEDARPWA
jgi:mono/diheme cytochrome c family protein